MSIGTKSNNTNGDGPMAAYWQVCSFAYEMPATWVQPTPTPVTWENSPSDFATINIVQILLLLNIIIIIIYYYYYYYTKQALNSKKRLHKQKYDH